MAQNIADSHPAEAKHITNTTSKQDWRGLVQTKQEQLQQEFPSEWRLSAQLLQEFRSSPSPKPSEGVALIKSDVLSRIQFFSQEEFEVTENYTATQLISKLASSELSSVFVTRAFCKRAAIAQQLTSCLTETFFYQALERAKYLDEYLRREGKVVGPLHGLPISIKDSFAVIGKQTTIGFVEFLKTPPAEKNSALVDLLLDSGCVLYVKTNVPQTLMASDSENNIFGRTLNPHKTSLTAGGSSGGEGALVAFKGSPLGVGTDLAGSIRLPALCCGLYGFRPTADRIPYGGQIPESMDGSVPGIRSCAGPLAHSLDDIELFMSTVLDAQPWNYDVRAIAAPWNRNVTATKKGFRTLTIGILAEHPQFPLHPPVRRALTSAVSALEAKGHRIVHLTQTADTDFAYANRLAFQYFLYGPHEDVIAASGEPPVKSVTLGSSPMFTGPLPVAMELAPFEKIDGLYKARLSYQTVWKKLWLANGLDAIVAPGAQSTAVEHDSFGWPSYTSVWNLLDYPACTIPYGTASKEQDPEPFHPHHRGQPSYHPEAVDGAPCAIQVITPTFQDEKCLLVAKIIDSDIR